MAASSALRVLTNDDAVALLDLITECDIATLGEVVTTADEIAADLANPDLVMVGIEASGQLVGHAWAEVRAGQSRVWADLHLRPRHEPEILTPLLEWVLDRAASAGPGRPIWLFSDSSNQAKCDLLAAAGGHVVRKFFRMVIDFDAVGPPESATLGDGVEIVLLPPTDEGRRTMHRIVDTAFVDHFGHEPVRFEDWERDTFGFCSDPSLYWLATVDGEPAAGLYGCVLPATGYVDTLGTLREFRGRGLGRALLLTAFGEFHRRGVRRVALGVDATSQTGAVGLYESVGMSPAREGWRYELPPARPEGE